MNNFRRSARRLVVGLSLLGGLAAPAALLAQPGTIDAGVLYFQEGRFEEAAAKIKSGLGSPELKEKHLAKGHTTLAQSYIMLFVNATKTPPDAKAKAWLDANPNCLLDAAASLEIAQKNDLKGFHTNEINLAYGQIGNGLYTEGFKYYQNKDYPTSIKYLDAAVGAFSKKGGFYAINQLRGYVFMDMKDTAKAKADFETCLKLYNTLMTSNSPNKPKEEDKNLFSVYYYLYKINVAQKNYDAALGLLDEGRKRFPAKANDFNTLESDIYEADPSRLDAGIKKYESLTASSPTFEAWMVYANLLGIKSNNFTDESYVLKSIEAYKKALALKQDDLAANFNLGAMYNNLAGLYNDQYNKLFEGNKNPDPATVDGLEAKRKQAFTDALPFMKKAYEKETDKGNRVAILTSLIQICTNLNKTTEAEFYLNERNNLK